MGKVGVCDNFEKDSAFLLFLLNLVKVLNERVSLEMKIDLVLESCLKVVEVELIDLSQIHFVLLDVLIFLELPKVDAILNYLKP